jgi:hypothetical protein
LPKEADGLKRLVFVKKQRGLQLAEALLLRRAEEPDEYPLLALILAFDGQGANRLWMFV